MTWSPVLRLTNRNGPVPIGAAANCEELGSGFCERMCAGTMKVHVSTEASGAHGSFSLHVMTWSPSMATDAMRSNPLRLRARNPGFFIKLME
ncbi:hypothetical protein D3C71_1670970 [compost metagenome]